MGIPRCASVSRTTSGWGRNGEMIRVDVAGFLT
jgi:hypothetical protein